MNREPSDSSANLNYLNVRLNGMEEDVELTPGYLKWREQATAEARKATDEQAARKERLEQRLGGEAVEQE